MSAETDAQQMREKIREHKATRGSKVKKEWVAPTLADFAYGEVLVFDQTLTKTGFALLRCDSDGLHVDEGNVLAPSIDPDLDGFEATFAKAKMLRQMMNHLLMATAGRYEAIVHEMPAVGGYRIESSLLAAQALRYAREDFSRTTPLAMVSNQAMRAMLNQPNQRYDKRYVKAAVEALVPAEQRHALRWTQDVHDAVALGLKYFYDQKRANQ